MNNNNKVQESRLVNYLIVSFFDAEAAERNDLTKALFFHGWTGGHNPQPVWEPANTDATQAIIYNSICSLSPEYIELTERVAFANRRNNLSWVVRVVPMTQGNNLKL